MKRLSAFLAGVLASFGIAVVAQTYSPPGAVQRGTAALPGVFPAGDRDTGLYWPSENNFGISTGAVSGLQLNASQHAGIGPSTAPTADTVLNVSETLTNMGAPFTVKIGTRSFLDLNPSAAPTNVYSYASAATTETRAGNAQNFLLLSGALFGTNHNGSGNASIVEGGYFSAWHSGAGTTTTARNGFSAAGDEGAITTAKAAEFGAAAYGTLALGTGYSVFAGGATATDTATVGTHYGVYVDVPYKDAGATVTNNYGLYVADQSAVGSTIARNIHSAGASSNNRFDGSVSIGGALTAPTLNGNTFTTGTYTLTGGAGKTLTFSNSLTLAGTDGTTMTFPAASSDIAAAPGADPAPTTLTNNTNRTPSVTRPTLVTITVDYNTLAAATARTCDVTNGAAAAVAAVYVWNGSAVSAARVVQSYTTIVKKNTAYKINCSSATNLTLTAIESAL